MAINAITRTDHDGLCECCDTQLTDDNLTEGDLGFYCSDGCLEEAEADDWGTDDRAVRRAESGYAQ